MKNIELAKLVYEMKPGDPPSLHMGTKWYTMWNSHTIEEAWQEAAPLFPDWEHDWNALKELLFSIMREHEFTLSLDVLEKDFCVEFYDLKSDFRICADTLEEAIFITVLRALTELKK